MYTHLAIQNVAPTLYALERVAPDYNFIPAVVGRATTGNLVIALVPLSVDSAFRHAVCQLRFGVPRHAAAGFVGRGGALSGGGQVTL